MIALIDIITSTNPATRNQSLESALSGKTTDWLLKECDELERFRSTSTNLYHKVRALFFLYAIYRFYIPNSKQISSKAITPYKAYQHILNRRFEEAIKILIDVQSRSGINEGLSSALSDAYHKLAFHVMP